MMDALGMPSIPRKSKRRWVPMIFAAGGWNANVLYVWATRPATVVTGHDPTVTVV